MRLVPGLCITLLLAGSSSGCTSDDYVRSEGPTYAIEVQDTGVGIPEEERSLLFNRFYRATHAQSEAINGSGLGLSIARSIAHLHGARISALSTPGQGSTFIVTFEEQGYGALTAR